MEDFEKLLEQKKKTNTEKAQQDIDRPEIAKYIKLLDKIANSVDYDRTKWQVRDDFVEYKMETISLRISLSEENSYFYRPLIIKATNGEYVRAVVILESPSHPDIYPSYEEPLLLDLSLFDPSDILLDSQEIELAYSIPRPEEEGGGISPRSNKTLEEIYSCLRNLSLIGDKVVEDCVRKANRVDERLDYMLGQLSEN